MLRLALPDRQRLEILCLGAHSDDIEIGCGGTLLHLLETRGAATVAWVVFAGHGPRAEEAVSSAHDFLYGAHERKVVIRDFRDGFFPYTAIPIKEYFEDLKRDLSPDLIFTHYRHDRHQDHRLISDLTWNTFRNHFILEYEIPKYDGDLSTPNLFCPLGTEISQRKVDLLIRHFQTQTNKHWFTENTFLALLRLRGVECGSEEPYAEAFYGRKILL